MSMGFSKVKSFLTSSTVLGFFVGLVWYLSYAILYQGWANVYLIALSIVVAVSQPYYHKTLKKIEDYVNFKLVKVTLGRLSRYIVMWCYYILLFSVLIYGKVFDINNLNVLGGIVGVAAFSAIYTQALKLLGLALSSRSKGNYNINVLMALFITTVYTAAATAHAYEMQITYMVVGSILAGLLLLYSGLSDLRGIFAPTGGIGIFFGTFNPFHNTHYDIIDSIFKERKLDKLFVHSTVIPKLHQDALRNGEIEISGYSAGMRVYEKTKLADSHKNYFPTGNRFFEYETRSILTNLALQDSQYRDKIVVLDYPEIYEKDGFYGLAKKIKELHPKSVIHGIHGSDSAGMWIRRILDESGWIYPYAVKRVNTISATAVRNGARGMTPNKIENILEYLRKEIMDFVVDGIHYIMRDGILTAESV